MASKYLPQLLSFSSTSSDMQKIMLEVEQLFVIFDQIHKDLEAKVKFEDLLQRIRYLTWMRWPEDVRVFRQCVSILSHYLEIAGAYPVDVEAIVSALFLKLYDFGPLTEDIAVPILRGLGKITINIRRPSLVRPNPDLFNLELTDLIHYLSERELDVRQGAARLMMFIVENYYSSPSREHSGEFLKIDVDIGIIERLIDSPTHLIKNLGISLLPFYTFSLQYEGKGLLSKILACHEYQEARAWSRFIQYMPVLEEPDHITAWKTFLETLLEKELQVLPPIRRAALSRYNKLVISQDNANVIDEHKLGLPLARDN